MSIELFFPTAESRRRLHAGPLAHDIDGFAVWLSVEGYARPSAREKLRFVELLSRWLESEELGVEDLDEQRVEAFLLARGWSNGRRGEAATGRQLLCYLRGSSVIPAAVPCPGSDTPIDRIGRIYERFLVNERGVSPATVTNYLPIVRTFLTEHFGAREVVLETLGVRDANQFVLRQARRLSRSRAQLVVTVLRSFLRHLYQRGDIPGDLSNALAPVRHWRLSGLPKALAPEQVESMLDSCDRGTAVGQRDYAVLLLLARLGLRAGEVVALTLDDFNWTEGIVTVPGKGKRREPLPLPRDAGEGLTEYLRAGRPACPTRRVFVRMHAPHRSFRSSAAICDIVRRALTRAGINSPFKGAHLLRHSLATSMLHNGASLEDIGQILRHRHPETTQIYAKVDLDALRALAPAWPGGAA